MAAADIRGYQRGPYILDHITASQRKQQIGSSYLSVLDEQMHNEVGLNLTENVAHVSTQRIITQRITT